MSIFVVLRGLKNNDMTSNARPCVVVQNNAGNKVSPMTIVAPLTDKRQFKGLPIQVEVSASELQFSGIKDPVVECGHLRTIDRDLRIRARLGTLDLTAMERVDKALAISIGLG